MKRVFLLQFLLVCSVLTNSFVWAQGTSDLDVMNTIVSERQAGRSQSQIVTKLVQSGVKVDQIRRVRNQSAQGGTATATGGTEGVSRLRQYNGGETTTTGGETGTQTVSGEGLTMSDEEFEALVEEFTPDGRRVFGRGIFNKKLLSFEPNMNIATPQNYVLGPGDLVFVDVYGASQRTEQLEVSPEGTVTIPGYGPVQVSGLTVAGANARIRSTLGSRYASSNVKLTVGQTRTVIVNVMGEVRAPGTYTLSAFSTVFHALYMAGGISSLGTLRNIKVFRQGRQITVVDVYEYILNGRLAGNVRLQDNDVIVVAPYDCLVDIAGSVKRPMTYEMRANESVGTLIKYAGGFTGDAYRETVNLKRSVGSRNSVYTVEEFDLNSFKLADGDVVNVAGKLNRYENMVEVKGAVFRPGQYQLGKEINSVKTLVEHADGLTEDAFMNRAVLQRMKADRTLETFSLDLKGIMAGTVPDVPLQNEDVLTISSQEALLSARTLTIEGEVQAPGTFPYSDNTTVEDLIVQAGGLTDAASTVKIDVSRRIRDPKAGEAGKEISKNYSFELKDGLIVEGERGFLLEPYDIIQVRRSPGYVMPRNIFVEGEVNFAGTHTLSMRNQRVSDAIKAAGGLTSEAYVKGARLIRQINSDERARQESILKTARTNMNDSIDTEAVIVPNEYVVGLQLDKALANPGSDYDVVLRDSDRIVVPEYNGMVRISGEVLQSNTVAFNKNKHGYKWYINQAGGYAERARRSETFIVYQNGTVSKASKGKVEPGCEIIVPTKIKRDRTADLTKWISIGGSAISLSMAAIGLMNVLKK